MLPGGKFARPRSKSNQGVKYSSKTPEGQKSELFKKVENLEMDNKEIKKTMEELKDKLKGKVIYGHFVEEEVVIDVNLINDGKARMMLVDCGAPKSVVSRKWIEGYLRDMKVDEEEMRMKSYYRNLEWEKQHF